MPARIGLTNDLVDARLVETLVAVVPLQNLQVRSERTFRREPLGLLDGDEALLHCRRRCDAVRRAKDRPW